MAIINPANSIRKTTVQISIAGVDATAALAPHLIAFECSDDIETNADTIAIHLDDTDFRFMRQWSIDKGTKIKASILQWNWATVGEGLKLDCGTFYVDEIDYTGPPNICIIKATSIPVAGSFKGVRKNRGYENTTLKDLAISVGAESNMGVDYRATINPPIKRTDQDEESDAFLLRRLCTNYGLMCKNQDDKILIFDEAELDQQAPWITFTLGASPIIHHQMHTSSQGRIAGMHSSYLNPNTGQVTQDSWDVPDKPEGVDGVDQEHDRPDYDPDPDPDLE